MLYPRKILENINKWIFEKEIIILNGPRQVGKTSLLKLARKQLLSQSVSEKNIFYLNLEEIDILSDLNENPENLLKYITNNDSKNYFFIDEIQYLDNPSNFLKHLFDKYSDKIKIIATGSSSLELKAQLQDSLAGRKVAFLIKPLDFEEFLRFNRSDCIKYLQQEKIPLNIKNELNEKLDEYLIFGGMPAIVLQKDHELKQKMLREYVGTYINKDIRSIGKIENISQFNTVIKILSSQIGNLLNISELSNTADIPRRKTEEYIDLLEYTFVLNKINVSHNNARKQITKMPKIYFFDVGIRNAILNNFLPMKSRQDRGSLFENFVFLELKNNLDTEVLFYRTISKSEIDFIVTKSDVIYAIEVKYKKLKKQIDSRILRGFSVEDGKKKKMFVINIELIGLKDGVEYVDYRNISRL